MTLLRAKVPLSSRLTLILALNLLLLVLFFWASLDTLTVRVQASGSLLTATVNGYQVTAQDTRHPTGGGALWLADERSYRNYVAPPTPSGTLDRLLTDLWSWDLASNLPSGWKGVRVEGQTTQGESSLRFEDTGFLEKSGWRSVPWGGRHPQETGFAPFGDPTWRDYVLEARLLRGREDAGILVRSTTPGTGYLFWFRPEHGDMAWQVWEDGHLVESLQVEGFRIPLLTGIKSVLRELLWSYFHGLALVGVIIGVGVPVGALAGRSLPWKVWRGRDVPPLRSGWRRWVLGDSSLALTLLVCLLALGITVTIASVLYDRIPHVQDSITYLFQAQTFAGGRIAALAPPLPEFFRQEFIVVQEGKWFGKYPPGHPLVLALGVLIGTPWLVGPIAGSLALGAIYMAGRAMYGSSLSLLAVILGLSSPFFLFLSASFMAHPTNLLFSSLFLLGFVRTHQQRSPGWALATGVFWGLALMTRSLDTIALAIPFALYVLLELARHPREGLRLYVGMVLGALPPTLFLLWYQFALTGSPFTQPYTLFWAFDRIGFGEAIGSVLGGHTPEAGLMNTWRNVTVLLVHLYGWLPYVSLAFACLPFVLLKATRWDFLLLGAALATVGVYVFYWADGIMFGPRYYYSALPALLLLTARGIQVAATAGLEARAMRARRLAQGGVAAVIVGVLVLGNLLLYLPGQVPVYADFNNIRGKPLERVNAAGLTNALVFVEDDPDWHWWKYGALFIGNSPWLDGEVIYARDLGPDVNRQLMEVYPTRKAYLFDGVRVRAVGK